MKITGKLLRPYQYNVVYPILTGKKKHLLAIHPRRAGKSFTAFYLNNALINKYWNDKKEIVNSFIFAPQQQQVREIYVNNIMKNGKKLFSIANAKYESSILELNYKKVGGFDSRIKFAGSDQIDNKMGGGAKIIQLDEYALSEKSYYAYLRLYPMIMDNDGHIIITSTVRGKNHMYDLWKQVKDDPEWVVDKRNAIELGLLTQKQYDDIPMDENLKRQEYLCDWETADEGAIYSTPNSDIFLPDQNQTVIIGFDLGFNDLTVAHFSQYINNKLYIFTSKMYSRQTMDDICIDIKRVLSTFNLQWKNVRICLPHDAAQYQQTSGTSRYMIVCKHFRTEIIPKTNNRMEDIDHIRRNWGDIIFHKINCSQAIEYIKKYVVNPITKEPDHKYSDTADSLRTLVCGVIKNNTQNKVKHYDSIYKF